MSSLPRKRFAQHWLRSEKALNNIVNAACLKKSDRLLEIGPGTGLLTQRLLPEVETLVAVEIDRDLCTKLVKKFGNQENFLLLQGDILTLDLNSILANNTPFQNPNKVVANIPYNITGPILQKLLGTIGLPVNNYELIVLLLQKEVADRLVAIPGTKAFGALSVRVQYLASCEHICDVPAKAFYPPPKVDSAVVRLQPQTPVNKVENPKMLDILVKQGFANKRKMLRNNLKGVIDSEVLTQILEKLNINPSSRAENLSVSEWVALTNNISSQN